MRITLVRPPFNLFRYEPPLGIASIAAYLEINGYEVSVVDCEALQINTESKLKSTLSQTRPDVVGISFFTYDRFSAVWLSEIAKSLKSIVIAGGVHITSVPKESLEAVNTFDYGVIGEGEATLVDLLSAIKEDRDIAEVNGIVYRDDGQIKLTPPRSAIPKLDTLPEPAYHLFPMDIYPYHAVMGSRGCPFNCIFCGSPELWKRSVRYRSAEKVVDEIENLCRDFGKKYIHFKDDNFMVNKKWGKSICDEIISRAMKIQWDCLGRVDCVDEEILRKAKTAGADRIRYGIESGSDRILKVAKKGITKEQVRNTIKLTRNVGFKRIGTLFIIGHPTETMKDIEETFNFSQTLWAEHISFKPLDIYPGTGVYRIALENNLLPKGFNWFEKGRYKAGFMTYDDVPSFEPEGITRKMLCQLSKDFYLRSFLNRIFSFRSISDFHYLTENEYGVRSISIEEIRYFSIKFYEEYKKERPIFKKIFAVLLVSFVFCRGLYLLFKRWSKGYEVGES